MTTTMTRPSKEALTRRAIPLLQLMIADGKRTLAIKNLVLELMTDDCINADAAYDRLPGATASPYGAPLFPCRLLARCGALAFFIGDFGKAFSFSLVHQR